jgi:integrase
MAVYAWCINCLSRWEKCASPLSHKEARKFRADFRLGGVNGTRIRRVHDKREQAEDDERDSVYDYKHGKRYPHLADEKRTFGQACNYYKETYLIPNKQFHDVSRIEMYREFFGDNTLLSNIDQDRCKEMFSKMTGYLQPSSVVRMWTLLLSIFRENAKWCPKNPAKGIIPKLYRKKANRPKTVYFTNEEYLQLLKHCKRIEDEDIIIVFRNTGFRTGDGEHFAVEHCDFTTNTIHIPEQKNQEAGAIPMVPEARKRILEIIRRRNLKSGLILNMQNAGKRFTRICKAAGLYKPYPNNKTLHSLRHSWGTYVQKAYKDINVTQKLMRHKTIGMTMRYAHAANEMLKSAALAGSAPSAEGGHNMDTENQDPAISSEKNSASS